MSVIDSFEKSPVKSIKHSTYFPVYEKLLARFVGTDFTFVEVGIAKGGSLYMWRDYFGPQARIIGIDINKGTLKFIEEGFEVFIGSQSEPEFWQNFYKQVGQVDVLLDDGGHTFEQQIITVQSALPYINDDGLIIVEDTHTSYMRSYGGPSKRSFVSYSKNIVDGMNYRFSLFEEKHRTERYIYSTQFFESFVVFEINKELCAIQSRWLENEGKEPPDDFFDYGNNRTPLHNYVSQLKIVKENKAFRTVALKCQAVIRGIKLTIKNNFLRKYFRY